MTAESAAREELLTVDAVAQRFNVSDKTIRRWLKEKRMAYVLIVPGNRIRIAQSEIVRLLKPVDNGQAPTS